MDREHRLRQEILALLDSEDAHRRFDDAIAELPTALRGRRPAEMPHTAWRLLEHLRITQRDILDYCRDADHASPAWPAGYWPEGDAPPSARTWDESVRAFRADLDAMKRLVADPATDLLAPLPANPEHTILGEALLLADHNAYHLGQLVLVRRALGAWSE